MVGDIHGPQHEVEVIAKEGDICEVSRGAETKMTDVFRWSREEMGKEIGTEKSKLWIASGLLPKAACPLTGSWHDDLVIFILPFY